MKGQLVAIVAAVLLVGCGQSQQSSTPAEAYPVGPVAEVPAQPSPPPVEAKPDEPVTKAAKPTTPPKAVSASKGADPDRGIKPKPPTVKAPDISIKDAAIRGNIEAVKQHLDAGTDVNAKDEGGDTPLDWVIKYKQTEIANLLRKHGGKTGEVLRRK